MSPILAVVLPLTSLFPIDSHVHDHAPNDDTKNAKMTWNATRRLIAITYPPPRPLSLASIRYAGSTTRGARKPKGEKQEASESSRPSEPQNPEPLPPKRPQFSPGDSGQRPKQVLFLLSTTPIVVAKLKNSRTTWTPVIEWSIAVGCCASIVGWIMGVDEVIVNGRKPKNPASDVQPVQPYLSLYHAALAIKAIDFVSVFLIFCPAIIFSWVRGPGSARHLHRAVLALPGPGAPTAQIDLYSLSLSRPVVTLPVRGSSLDCVKVVGKFIHYEYTISGRALDGNVHKYRLTFAEGQPAAVVNGDLVPSNTLGALLESGWSRYGGELSFRTVESSPLLLDLLER